MDGRQPLAIRMVVGAVLAVLVAACTASSPQPSSGSPAAAGQPTGGLGGTATTLDKVLQSKSLRIGIQLNSEPWGFYDKDNKPIGMDVDLAQMIADDLKAKLEIVPIANSAARISALLAGDVDIVSSNFTVTPDRAQSIWFTIPVEPNTTVIVARKDMPQIKELKDLAGHKVSIVIGSIQENIPKLVPNAQYTRFQDPNAAIQALLSGQVDVFTTNAPSAKKLVTDNPNFEIRGDALHTFNSLGVRRGDYDWLQYLNTSIVYHGGNGDIEAAWNKWFPGLPMPRITPSY